MVNFLEDKYEPHFEQLGTIIREKIGTASPVHIACSAFVSDKMLGNTLILFQFLPLLLGE